MSMFRKRRISDDQLKDLLSSLPQVKASADFEEKLGQLIESRSAEVPHILGSLPLVSAPDDFDAKLMEAIQERKRPIAPVMTSVADSAIKVNWVNSIAGWMGGALMVVGLAFFIDRAVDVSEQAHPRAVAPAPAAASRNTPAPAPPSAPQVNRESVVEQQESVMQAEAEPAAVAALPAPVASARVQKQVIVGRTRTERPATLTNGAARSVSVEQRQVSTPVQSLPAEPELHITITPATTAAENEADTVAPERGISASSVPTVIVDTGGERDSSDNGRDK